MSKKSLISTSGEVITPPMLIPPSDSYSDIKQKTRDYLEEVDYSNKTNIIKVIDYSPKTVNKYWKRMEEEGLIQIINLPSHKKEGSNKGEDLVFLSRADKWHKFSRRYPKALINKFIERVPDKPLRQQIDKMFGKVNPKKMINDEEIDKIVSNDTKKFLRHTGRT